jgi:hypothetical protein
MMKLHPLLFGTLLAVALSGCNEAPAPVAPATTAEPAAAPAVAETQAFYGDEAPVALPAEPIDDHGHSHDGDADHAHGDDTHSHDAKKTDDHGHDHGDGSEPHDH